MSLYVLLLGAAIVVVLLWNFVPAIRARMRGLSTIAEGGLIFAFQQFDVFVQAVLDLEQFGVGLGGIEAYWPIFLLIWLVAKRYQTKTPAMGLSRGLAP